MYSANRGPFYGSRSLDPQTVKDRIQFFSRNQGVCHLYSAQSPILYTIIIGHCVYSFDIESFFTTQRVHPSRSKHIPLFYVPIYINIHLLTNLTTQKASSLLS